jgi:hypothetical protein
MMLCKRRHADTPTRRYVCLRVRRDRGHFAPRNFILIVAPGETVPSCIYANHPYASLHGTDQRAKVAAHTRLFDDFGDWLPRHSARSEP